MRNIIYFDLLIVVLFYIFRGLYNFIFLLRFKLIGALKSAVLNKGSDLFVASVIIDPIL